MFDLEEGRLMAKKKSCEETGLSESDERLLPFIRKGESVSVSTRSDCSLSADEGGGKNKEPAGGFSKGVRNIRVKGKLCRSTRGGRP